MEFKGTKGKWEVKHSNSKTAYNVVGTALGGKYKIARCPYVKSPIKADENEAQANAQLIAAAPELLDALQDIVRFCEDNDINIVLDYAKDTISKALGKEVTNE